MYQIFFYSEGVLIQKYSVSNLTYRKHLFAYKEAISQIVERFYFYINVAPKRRPKVWYSSEIGGFQQQIWKQRDSTGKLFWEL